MSSKVYIVLLLLLSFLSGCGDEKDITPSYEDVDWYVIQDNPSNPLEHLIYGIYVSTGIPIFYSDTIGRQFRGFDVYGDSIIFKQVINISYGIDQPGSTFQSYTLSDNSDEIRKGVEFLRDYVIPRLVANTKPKGFLLVDELLVRDGSKKVPGTVYRSYDATTVGRIKEIGKMSEDELQYMAALVLSPGFGKCIDIESPDKLVEFIKLSYFSTAVGLEDMHRVQVNMSTTATSGIPFETPMFYGFLDFSRNDSYTMVDGGKRNSYTCPSRLDDITAYVTEVLYGNDDAFEKKFGEYELCMKKYEIMKKIVAELIAEKQKTE